MISEYGCSEASDFIPNATVSVSGPLPPELNGETSGRRKNCDVVVTEDGEAIPVADAIGYDDAVYSELEEEEEYEEEDGDALGELGRLFVDSLLQNFLESEYFVTEASYTNDGERTVLRFPDDPEDPLGYSEISFQNSEPTLVTVHHSGKNRFLFVLEEGKRHRVAMSDAESLTFTTRCTKLDNRLGENGGALRLEFSIDSYMPAPSVKITYKVRTWLESEESINRK